MTTIIEKKEKASMTLDILHEGELKNLKIKNTNLKYKMHLKGTYKKKYVLNNK